MQSKKSRTKLPVKQKSGAETPKPALVAAEVKRSNADSSENLLIGFLIAGGIFIALASIAMCVIYIKYELWR